MWRIWQLWVSALAILILATLGKQFSNDWYSYTHKGPARGLEDAKSKGLFITKFRIDPPTLKFEDKNFDLGEAWVEARYEQRDVLVWYSYMGRADWDFFCLRPKTDCFQGDISITLTPEFSPPVVSDVTGELNYFSQTGDFWYQRVPTDLQRVKVTVTAKFYKTGKNIAFGTAELTRE